MNFIDLLLNGKIFFLKSVYLLKEANMTNAAIREQLHHFIDVAEDKEVEAIYHIIEKETGNEKYTPDELAEFYNRLEKYNKGEMPSFSIEEAHDYVRQNKNGK